MSNRTKIILAILFVIGIGFCLYSISIGNLSTKEVALLSIVLTTLSIMATWIVTHFYSESQHKKSIQEAQESHRTNLRTFGLKAQEKVNNLSTQLSRLAAYLEESLEEGDDERPREDLLSKQERIESAIHMINILKSVNDTTLSDWEGVIGDELEEQRELQAEREEELRGIVERLDAVSESQIYSQQYTQDSTQALTREMDSLRKDLRSVVLSLGLSPIRRLVRPSEKKPRQTVEILCPACGANVTYKQRTNPKSIKALKCGACGTKLYSQYDAEKGFTVETCRIATEQVACPSCGATSEIELDILPGSLVRVECQNCQKEITVTRTKDGILTKLKGMPAKAEPLTEEIVESVKDSLPPQPWPKGVNKSVADKLGLSNKLVSEAIQKLIRKGVFNPQIDGKIYVPQSSVKKQKPQAKKAGEG